MKVLKTFESKHEGRGSFSFIPNKGSSYSVKVVKPKNSQVFFLPKIEESGIVAKLENTVIPTDSVFSFTIQNSSPQPKLLKVAIYQKEKWISGIYIKLSPFESRFYEMSLSTHAVGVLRFTVYEIVQENNIKAFLPQFERLLFRKPKHNVQLSVSCKSVDNTEQFGINSLVLCTVSSKDENNHPISLFLTLDVVDDSVLSLIEKRKRRLQLSEKVLLGDEFEHVEDGGA
eukprot:TRINITY_DN6856_c0_g1_i1.p1 TRINITY_DN6856_c0_g1~~TRINITY_DN6856_c0_g1_i1.p1  ORF type:complete len:247 (-),score=71.43 TRINITY_DN6856_c0_g1_i1:125-811(-)